MLECDPASDRINSFAVVGYIPGQLGEFISELRRYLVSGCVAQSHVSILPPRPLFVDVAVAQQEVCRAVADFPPVELEFSEICLFEQTSVIYADLAAGREGLIRMHDTLNRGSIEFAEPFPYHPHITLAQGVAPEKLSSVYATALQIWKSDLPATSFPVESLTFVQNTAANLWIDLADCKLGRRNGTARS